MMICCFLLVAAADDDLTALTNFNEHLSAVNKNLKIRSYDIMQRFRLTLKMGENVTVMTWQLADEAAKIEQLQGLKIFSRSVA